jgi:hypothetical protein
MERKCSTCKFFEPKDSTCHREAPHYTDPTARFGFHVFQKVAADAWCGQHEPRDPQGQAE